MPDELICVIDLPVAIAPSWQLLQVPITDPWSICATGTHPVELWQSSHVIDEFICVIDLPVAIAPSWQLLQVPITDPWSICATGNHAEIPWQSSHVFDVLICVADLPVAVVPSWQLEHVPLTDEWSTVAGTHPVVLWQSSHVIELELICVADLPSLLHHRDNYCRCRSPIRDPSVLPVPMQLLLWQSSHVLDELICVIDLPVAIVPSWQLLQVPITDPWSICATGTMQYCYDSHHTWLMN